MSFIPVITDSGTNPAMADAHVPVQAGRGRGRVPNIFGIHGVRPAAMLVHLRLHQDVMFAQSPLTRIERETVAVAVSSANRCRY
jgi:alkylhydroperoxidase family enzyme